MKTGFIHLDPALSRLEILAHPLVIAVAGGIYVIEFVADKIPWVDSLWDTVHTLIRPVGAAVLAAVALGEVDPVVKLVAVLVCGSVALASHAGKAGIRLAVNHSPEPFTNVGLSLAEDGIAVAGVWLAIAHPYVMLAIVAVWLAALAWLLPKIFRLAKGGLRALYRWLHSLLDAGGPAPPTTEPRTHV